MLWKILLYQLYMSLWTQISFVFVNTNLMFKTMLWNVSTLPAICVFVNTNLIFKIMLWNDSTLPVICVFVNTNLIFKIILRNDYTLPVICVCHKIPPFIPVLRPRLEFVARKSHKWIPTNPQPIHRYLVTYGITMNTGPSFKNVREDRGLLPLLVWRRSRHVAKSTHFQHSHFGHRDERRCLVSVIFHSTSHVGFH